MISGTRSLARASARASLKSPSSPAVSLFPSSSSTSRHRGFHSTPNMRRLHVDQLNPSIKNVQYAVRGELAIKAEVHREKLKEGDHGLPFDTVVSSNIGNPQQKGLDQPPITFNRQVRLGLLSSPTHPPLCPVTECTTRSWVCYCAL